VKTCGKSARRSQAIEKVDKPCGVKCHIHFGFLRKVELLAQLDSRKRWQQEGVGRLISLVTAKLD